MEISIKGLPKGKVLAALYNYSRPKGMGFLHFTPVDMTEADADKLLEATNYFDYVHGRVMKVRIEGDSLNPGLYDRDNGEGAAARAIAKLT